MAQKNASGRRFIDALTMFIVCSLSLLLLVYVAYGEAQRHFLQFHLEKLQAQARIVQSAVESYLRPGGLPLRQYVGFSNLADPMVNADPWVASLTAFDERDQPVFRAGDPLPLLPRDDGAEAYGVRRGADYFQAVLPLRNKFETVGSLAISMPYHLLVNRVASAFEPLLMEAGALSLAFTLFVTLAGPRLAKRRLPWLQIAYAATFLVMTGFVITTLISLYSEGAQAKAKALADTLVQRVDDIVDYNLNFDGIGGLDRTFAEYQRLNPDISAAGLSIDGVVTIHTDPAAIGRPWVADGHSYQYSFDIVSPENPRKVTVAVALPVDVVYRQVLRSVKNFTALFVASAFLAGIFLQLASSVQRSAAMRGGTTRSEEELRSTRDELALDFVKPVFFVAVFIEHLTYAFLPQFMHHAAAASGYSAAAASVPFMIYYLVFALSLIPAGHFAQRYGTRMLMWCGLLLSGGSLAMLALPLDFHLVVLARALAGIGQGVLFISVQSYILTMAQPGKKTQGAAIIVWGFQGGMISGMAIGSLLVTYLGPAGVFSLAGLIALLMAAYVAGLVPSAPRQEEVVGPVGASIRRLGHDMAQVLRDGEFLRTMLLVGVPAKAVMTGVIIFALPLLLTKLGFAQEDIGQILMVYAFGVLVASTLISRMVDRTGNTDGVLFRGAALSGVGLVLAGAIGWNGGAAGPLGTVLLIAGVFIVGIAHGFINAPVVTHIADSELAARIGASAATATYRFLERVGHVAGPIVVGQLFLVAGQTVVVVTWIGFAVLLFGFLFLLRPASSAATQRRPFL